MEIETREKLIKSTRGKRTGEGAVSGRPASEQKVIAHAYLKVGGRKGQKEHRKSSKRT